MSDYFYLAHGGPGSGRYPWGSGDRPYQRLEGSKGRSGGISGYFQSRKAKKEERRVQKAEQDERERKMKEALENKRLEENKERVLRSGTAQEVMQYQGKLTNQELQNAFTRLNLESQLRNLSQKEIKSNLDKIDAVMKNVKMGTEWVKIGTDTYNTIAKIYNATGEGKKSPLTIVGGGGEQKKK